MNAHDKKVELHQALKKLPGLGYFEDDIEAQLKETAKGISQDIVDLLSSQYRDARKKHGGVSTLPSDLWQPLRSKAYKIAAEHCDALARDLRKAAKDPNMAL